MTDDERRDILAETCAGARQMVALMLDRLGVDDDDAREVIRGLIGELGEMLDAPDGVDVALWDREMSQ